MISNEKYLQLTKSMIENKIDSIKTDVLSLLDMSLLALVQEEKETVPVRTKAVELVNSDDIKLPVAETKGVIVEAPVLAKAKAKVFLPETVPADAIEIAPEDYNDTIVVSFPHKSKVSVIEFMYDMPFEKVLNWKKHYPFSVIKNIYRAYTGEEIEDESLVSACEGKDYTVGVTLAKHDGKIVYSFKHLQLIQANIDNNNYTMVKAEEKSAEKNTQKKNNRVPSEIMNYLLNEVNIESVIKNNYNFDDLTEQYNSCRTADKQISSKHLRNKFTYYGISGKSVTGHYAVSSGKVLGDMLVLLRHKAKAENDESWTRVVKNPSSGTESTSSGLTSSIGEILSAKALS